MVPALPGVRGRLCDPSYWNGGIWGWLVNREPPKGSKWPAEGLHYTWGFNSGWCTPRFLLKQTEFQSAWVCMAAWCRARGRIWLLAATVLGLTRPREEECLFCFRTWDKIPNGIPTFLPSVRRPFKQNKQNKATKSFWIIFLFDSFI